MTTAIASQPTTSAPHARHRFFAADDFDFCARTVLGHAAQGVIDLGLTFTTVDRITDGDPVSWYQAWHDTADALQAQAWASRSAGNTRTAAAEFLAAAEAYDQALAFVDGMPDDSVLLPTFGLHRQCWDEFVKASDGRHLPLAVPYEGDTIPGYLLRPDSTGRSRPTVVVTNGSDGSLSGLYATIAKGALERDWNVFVFDGPGQQSTLFERDIPFRHDWEAVLTPVIDVLVARPDVDGGALLAYGISQGGYWVPRALAFEHRFVAAVVDGGVVDVSRAWYAELPPQILTLFRSGEADAFNRAMSVPTDPATRRKLAFRARPYGASTPFELLTEVGRYALGDLAADITTPMLVIDADDDQFFAGQPRELFDALRCVRALAPFTYDQGANQHCEPMARALLDRTMGDFFVQQLAAARP